VAGFEPAAPSDEVRYQMGSALRVRGHNLVEPFDELCARPLERGGAVISREFDQLGAGSTAAYAKRKDVGDVAPRAAAPQFSLRDPRVASTIGISDLARVEQMLRLAKWRISDAVWRKLGELAEFERRHSK
jgi:aryl-alcohol dehydrogenase-like predicted oxidoreductase